MLKLQISDNYNLIQIARCDRKDLQIETWLENYDKTHVNIHEKLSILKKGDSDLIPIKHKFI